MNYTNGYLADGKRYIHVSLAEKALGRKLPEGAEVHHVNENKVDNRPENLVICPSRSYHGLLHQRTRALEMCGNANWRRCSYCQQYDDPLVMYIHPNGKQAHHRECRNKYQRKC